MGYFSNGTQGEAYEAQWCDRCYHRYDEDNPCVVWLAHLMKNYEESDKEDSILHMLIPRSEDGLGNEKCKMFVPRMVDRRQS
jgi:hypothetical protein